MRSNVINPVVVVQKAMQQVYLWMTAGLMVTGAVATTLYNSGFVATLGPLMIVLLIAQIGVVFYLSARINQMAPTTATLLFLVYSAMTGITLTPIFYAYSLGSIGTTFFVTAGTFATMALYGATTKRDLTGMGSMLMMALIGLMIATIVNIFLGNSLMSLVISALGVLIFTGLTAYDVQALTRMANNVSSEDDTQRFAIIGALKLYLDFINLFLYMLRFLGSGRRD
jgi:FtsH-binding integral membrane protein